MDPEMIYNRRQIQFNDFLENHPSLDGQMYANTVRFWKMTTMARLFNLLLYYNSTHFGRYACGNCLGLNCFLTPTDPPPNSFSVSHEPTLAMQVPGESEKK